MEITMKKIITALRNLLRTGSFDGMTSVERYLANSTDLVDLERRQRELMQPKTNHNLKGWV